MKRPWNLLALAGVWALTVVAGSAVVWGVISQAGAQVGADRPQPLPVATPASTASQPQQVPSTQPAPPPASSAPVAPPPASTSSTASTTRTTTTRTVPPSSRWSGAAGQIVAQCVGGAVTGTATPEGGWSVSAERKNGTYQVEFKRGDDNEVKIIATCAEGGGVRFVPGS